MISAGLLCPWVPAPRRLPSSPSHCLATAALRDVGRHLGQLVPGLRGLNGPCGLMRSPDPQALGWKEVLDMPLNFQKPHHDQEAKGAWSPQTVPPTRHLALEQAVPPSRA